jgi:geranylgeranyl reductase family protein
MRVFDACIVGAGPAGAALAAHLSRDGCSVALLERHRFPRDKVCGDLVSAKGMKMLDDLGCYEDVARRGFVPLKTAQAYLDGRFLVEAPLPTLPNHPPAGHAVPRYELDELLFRNAAAAGAHTTEECTVTGYELGRSLVTVSAEVDGRSQRFLSRLIVGADGAGSVIARQAGMEARDPRHVQLAMRAYCYGLRLDRAILLFDEDFFPGYAWVFPINESLANIGVGMVKESLQRDSLRLRRFYGRLVEFVRRIAREQGVEIELTRPAGWPIKTYGGAGSNYFDRGLLIGDAGCFVDPISGEGIPLALQSAKLAAETIRGAFAVGRFDAAVMADFERRWRGEFDADLRLADLVVTAIRNRRFVKLWTQSLRVIALTASKDRAYAQKVGGILAGLVPCRAALSADVVLKSLLHGPEFWVQSLSLVGGTRSGDQRADAEPAVDAVPARSSAEELRWFGDWAAEVAAKQLSVARRFWTTASRSRR